MLALLAALASPAPRPSAAPPDDPPALRQAIRAILTETGAPGAGIALVERDGRVWADGIGWADEATRRPATADTLFPVGSISKMFVSLSVLKLAEEGRIHLDDPVRALAPELAFRNRWESVQPLRVADLLEHTAGWDENLPDDSAPDPAPAPSRRELWTRPSLARTSRWAPGTCFSYTNLGPAAAAYLIEKVTGMPYEAYVARSWLAPLGMEGAAFTWDPGAGGRLAAGRRGDGERVDFRPSNLLLRPAGGLVASPRSLANLVQFYLGRGSFRGARLLRPESLLRMERPATSYAARAGLARGYGLGNATVIWHHWVFHGHGGDVPGAHSDLLYLPEAGLGYALTLNADNPAAMNRLENLLRAYLLRGLKPPAEPPALELDAAAAAPFLGWYRPFTPRNERSRRLENLLGLTRVSAGPQRLVLGDLTNGSRDYFALSPLTFRRADDSRAFALVAGPGERYLQFAGGPTFRRIPRLELAGELGFVILTLLLAGSTLIFAGLWMPAWMGGRLRQEPYLGVRSDPVWAALCGVAVAALYWNGSNDYYARAGGAIWSGPLVTAGFYLVQAAFAHFSIRGLLRAWRRRGALARGLWWHAFATSGVLGIWSTYLCYVGLRMAWG